MIGDTTEAALVVLAEKGGLAWRTNRRSLLDVGLFTNRLLLVGIAVEIAMIALLAYTPWLGGVFHTGPLSGWEWLFLFVWPGVVLGADEARKAIARKRFPDSP